MSPSPHPTAQALSHGAQAIYAPPHLIHLWLPRCGRYSAFQANNTSTQLRLRQTKQLQTAVQLPYLSWKELQSTICYLEAVARRELAGNPARAPSFESSVFRWVSARRGRAARVFGPPPNNFHSSCHFRRILACHQSHPQQ